MDVEKTIEHILEQQSEFWAAMKAAETRADRADKRMDRAEARMDRAEARMDRAEARMDRFERSLEGIRKLLQYGMKMLAQTEGVLRELAASQKITDRKLQAFIDSLQKGGGNGRRRS